MMETIKVRRFETLSSEIPRYYFAGSPFATHLLNALSSTFSFGEAFFVRAVLHYRDRDQITDVDLLREIRAFAGQEGHHCNAHDQHMAILIGQGYTALETHNRVGNYICRLCNRWTPKLALAVSASLEHLITLMARRILGTPYLTTDLMHPEMARLWNQHALEETEHKAVVFDVLKQVAPSYLRRVFVMLAMTAIMTTGVFMRLTYMLWKDGELFRTKTWSFGWHFLFGGRGLFEGTWASYSAWYRRDFHPNGIDDRSLVENGRQALERNLGIAI